MIVARESLKHSHGFCGPDIIESLLKLSGCSLAALSDDFVGMHDFHAFPQY